MSQAEPFTELLRAAHVSLTEARDALTGDPEKPSAEIAAYGTHSAITAVDRLALLARRYGVAAEFRASARSEHTATPVLSDPRFRSAAGDVAEALERAIIQNAPGGGFAPTSFWQSLRNKLSQIKDLKFICFDPLTAWAAADVEKDNLAAAALMMMLSQLAADTGATVMLTHHVTKGAPPENLSEARDSVRGAGALVNNGRWALVLWEATPDKAKGIFKTLGTEAPIARAGQVYFGGLAKGNAPGVKELRTFVRNMETGLLEDTTDAIRDALPKRAELDAAVYAALISEREKNPRFAFTSGEKSLAKAWEGPLRDAGLEISRSQMKACFDRLERQGAIARTGEKQGYAVYEPVQN